MSENKTSKTKKQTTDSEKPIHQRIDEKRSKLMEIHGSLAMWLNTELSPAKKIKAKELQDRLDFRILQAEEQLLDDKIDIYQETLNVFKK